MVTALVYGIPPFSGRCWAVVNVEDSADFVHTEPPCSLVHKIEEHATAVLGGDAGFGMKWRFATQLPQEVAHFFQRCLLGAPVGRSCRRQGRSLGTFSGWARAWRGLHGFVASERAVFRQAYATVLLRHGPGCRITGS